MSFLYEIQGLRAIAVILVLLFHLWPELLPGGYVGVDVFFVISGFLITGILYREVGRTGSIDVLYFYARRIRRLMPVATLVILVVLVLLPLFATLYWSSIVSESLASLYYLQNWHLAWQATDYLGAENAPSPLQHFWSLAVEEQYYAVWPLLILFGFRTFKVDSTKAFQFFSAFILLVGSTSLVWSIYQTQTSSGMAYFSTFTRAWELALGGALAITMRWRILPERQRSVLGVVGVGLIMVAAATFSRSTPFPSYYALVPTVGAGLVIISSSTQRVLSVYTLLKSRPCQYLGGISYSLYLWHWPLMILVTSSAERDLGFIDGCMILLSSVAVSHFSKTMIEDRFRGSPKSRCFKRKTFALAGVLFALTTMLIGWSYYRIDSAKNAATEISSAAEPLDLEQALLSVEDDKADAYFERCIAKQRTDEVYVCRYGNSASSKRVLIAGDSHAVHWLPPLQQIADHRDWNLGAVTKSGCSFGAVPVVDRDKTEMLKYKSQYLLNPRYVDEIHSALESRLLSVLPRLANRSGAQD